MSLGTIVEEVLGYSMPGVGAGAALGSFFVESLAKAENYITAANAAEFNFIHNVGVAGVVTAAVGCAIFYVNYQRKAIESLDRKFNEKLEYSFNQF